ncbi:MAG: Ig-like domain-containing protein [Proteobacteria bacterium]|nr:Ig-like domain-containing protein [Pseudomonadota bacterium]
MSSCYETSYDKAIKDLNNPPPPPLPPPPGGFAPTFSAIQANVFTPSCATAGCHAGANPPASLNLDATNSYAMLVGVASSQNAGVLRVNPGMPNNSYLIQKLEGTGSDGRMPPSGALPAASITTIRQWITDGAMDDRVPASTPIRVASLSVVSGSTLTTTPAQITASFDRDVDANTVNANTFILLRSNNNGVFGDGDDIAIAAASVSVPGANPRNAVFSLSGITLVNDTYRVRLLGTGASIIMDLDTNALDGEFSGGFPSGNGVQGGDFNLQFTMQVPVVLGPTLDQIQAVIFTPSCATAGCHGNGSAAAGLSLDDADSSYFDLVGQFSSQNGQSNVMLVAAGFPDNSYLIRKLRVLPGPLRVCSSWPRGVHATRRHRVSLSGGHGHVPRRNSRLARPCRARACSDTRTMTRSFPAHEKSRRRCASRQTTPKCGCFAEYVL